MDDVLFSCVFIYGTNGLWWSHHEMKYRSRNNKIDQIYSVTNEPEAKFVFIGPCSSVVAVATDHVRKARKMPSLDFNIQYSKIIS